MLAKAGDFTIYTSHEGYDKIIKEMDNQSAMDSNSNTALPVIIDIIKDKTVYFDSYRAGFFYYRLRVDSKVYQFTVDIEDIGDATLNNSGKAIIFMRWIRKAIENNQFILIANYLY